MPGVKELRALRLAAEDTPGTRVSPRYLWRGPVEGIDDQREITTAEEHVGIFGGTDRSYTPKLMAELPLAETEVTYQQIADIFQMCGFGTSGGGNRAGSAQGASGSTAIFTLPIPTSTMPVTYAYTAEVGDQREGAGGNNNAEYMPYSLCKELTLTGAGGAALKMEATLIGRFGTATNAMGSYSNAGTLVQVEEVLAGNGTVYMAPVTSSFGNHLVTPGNILGCKITFTPKWEPKFPIDAGITYFHTAVYTGCDIEGELTMEYQISGTFGASGSAGVVEKWRQEQPLLLRMQWPGATIPEGTTHLTSLLRIDLPIKIKKAEPLDDQNGNDIRVMTFESRYNESSPTSGRGTVTVARLGTSEFAGA
jgi:hypothetical protein